MDNWDEIRTAYQVARMGTVSGAAEVLGVHHATVIRHIDALEKRLGVRLFQRHARGYTTTEAGQDLLRVAQTTDDQFAQLQGRLKGQGSGVSGELVVTSLGGMGHLIVPVLAKFQADHPGLIVRYLTSTRLFRLEYGEAHVAIRAGNAPDQPDNVVRPLFRHRFGLFASHDYIAAHGMPKDEMDHAGHMFVGYDDTDNRAPFGRWLRTHVPEAQIAFRATDMHAQREAIRHGVGIGFVAVTDAQNDDTLVPVGAVLDEWSAPIWIVTHMDLHRTAKVQAFLEVLRSAAKTWDV
ncbi:LysR family transcriptional regulator [Litorivita pollutaquae]|uniref:LysR family transcriptional regulator n=1 Tax=Litorivita pollutaquae TaxID=2200892 RepID=A0A2V4N2N7_9RHOB|nr:LysR family transcriptional regulator [Litorivita pollutaquae]OUS20519.1 LysR family transcriptional regulator [Rhodobacterales bacterium 59_46_T64]PYC49054.1 LysR family transcriptional regulator [Litorivita pollutaquae]